MHRSMQRIPVYTSGEIFDGSKERDPNHTMDRIGSLIKPNVGNLRQLIIKINKLVPDNKEVLCFVTVSVVSFAH